jgi:hypothetical protein
MQDCGFASVMAGIIHVSPDWLASKISFWGNSSDVYQVVVSVYQPGSLTPKPQVVDWEENLANNDNAGPVWSVTPIADRPGVYTIGYMNDC